MPYLFDGYNLLRAVQKMEEFASFSDVQLCRAISDFLSSIRQRGSIIFDGIGPADKSAFEGMRYLEVHFSGSKKEADDIIEDMILDNTAPKRLVVVSSDRRLRAAATKRKAAAVTATAFWIALLRQLEKAANKPMPEPSQKRGGLSKRETDIWLKIFGMNQ
ncbi:MAG TPA: NYN domain-containing protein [Anaerohalosphaeraceae bacterium]|nr:NYN domain-containing protein [Anaerohalosphaeraceae bacterium]HOL30621.1 NYN domain-containing protein [Anaerohalosphaeraceae bacterium]HOM75286.1 NYN domain-containing protein [Anaerohalosphaeraceae bacterium]HPC63114.1 NYN domain-containing protein [Anaerohalosphaeraceae bacterium]HPO70563.1 NYN domain-containing protein [Anaerohalosphaeraceae bacterium]